MESDISHYVIETLDDTEENSVVLEGNSIVICSEDGEQQQYVPCGIENGQVILKRIEDVTEYRLDNTQQISESIVETKPSVEELILKKQENNRIYSNPNKQRKRKTNENEFIKPCMLPPNRGGMKGIIRYGRKHLIIDQQTMISPREFKAQLNNAEDLIMKPDFAPCTKQQMRHVLTGITRLFAYPSHKMPNNKLLQLYISNCTSRKQPNIENVNDMKLLPIGYKVEVDTSKIKRITRKRRYPEAEEYIRQQLQNQNKAVDEQNDTQQLVEAANTASTDHGYTNKTEEYIETDDIKEDEPIYIMHSVDENGVQNSFEVLLQAAAVETIEEDGQEYHHVSMKDDSDNGYQRIYILQEDSDEVLCMPSEYILP